MENEGGGVQGVVDRVWRGVRWGVERSGGGERRAGGERIEQDKCAQQWRPKGRNAANTCRCSKAPRLHCHHARRVFPARSSVQAVTLSRATEAQGYWCTHTHAHMVPGVCHVHGGDEHAPCRAYLAASCPCSTAPQHQLSLPFIAPSYSTYSHTHTHARAHAHSQWRSQGRITQSPVTRPGPWRASSRLLRSA